MRRNAPVRIDGSPCPDDDNVCTDDQCDSFGVCQHPNNSTGCDDTVFCNGTDTCSGGSCVHAGDPCPGPDGDGDCAESCDEGVDMCTGPDTGGSACAGDGNACTDDVCDGAGGCGVNNTDPCDDLNACTGTDTCGGGSCLSGAPLICDDDNICTQDSCDTVAGCAYEHTPATTSCKVADKSILLLKNNADDSKDKLLFKWLKGEETTLEQLGTPTGTTNYTFCLYAGTSSASVAMEGGSKWQPLGSKGFKYKDINLSSDGAQKAVLKSGATGRAKALVKGKGDNLPNALVRALPLPVVAQLVNDENSTCFEGVYDTEQVIKNTEKLFKAKAQQ